MYIKTRYSKNLYNNLVMKEKLVISVAMWLSAKLGVNPEVWS